MTSLVGNIRWEILLLFVVVVRMTEMNSNIISLLKKRGQGGCGDAKWVIDLIQPKKPKERRQSID